MNSDLSYRISDIRFPRYVERILACLAAEGYDAYAVGGCIRDSILGRTPNDWDITTEAEPSEVVRIFSEGDICVISTAGIRHGTVMVKAWNEICEITTFRSDGDYKDHRHPDSVLFSDRIEDDLSRRDFTMNAIAAKPDHGGVIAIDPFGGIRDIETRIIRAVGDPRVRFTEDALRILRTVRFCSELGFEVEQNTFEAALELSDTLEYVSAERITSELWRTLSAPFTADAVRSFARIFEWIIDEKLPDRFLRHISDTSEPYVRLALMLEHGSDIKKLLKRLRLSSSVIQCVRSLLSITGMPVRRSDVCMIMQKWDTLIPVIADYLQILKIDGVFHDGLAGKELIEESVSIAEEGIPYRLSHLAIRGGDLIEIGVEPVRIGECLEYLLSEIWDERVRNERESLLSAASKKYLIE